VTIQPVPSPQPLPSRPGQPTIQPVPGPGTRPTTRPAGPQNTRELRGYPPSTNVRPAVQPNAFSGSTGGRPESARGNRSLNSPPKTPSAPTKAPSAAPRAAGGNRKP
jgi:hypothetical protein